MYSSPPMARMMADAPRHWIGMIAMAAAERGMIMMMIMMNDPEDGDRG